MELPLIVSIRFQVLFHSPNRGAFHLSLTVLCSLSVTYEYLGLEGGPPMFRQDYTCPALLEDQTYDLRIQGYHLLWRIFPDTFAFINPATGLLRVRSPLLTESR